MNALHHNHPTPCTQLNSSSSYLTMQLWSGGKEIENVLLISLFLIWEQSWRISVHGQRSMCKILGSACLLICTTMLELMHIMLFKARQNQANACVAVPCRNQRLFRCVFRSCCCIQSTVSLNSTHIRTSTKHISAPPCKFSNTVLWMQWCDQNMRRNNLQISTRDCNKQYFNLCHLHCSWMPCLKMVPWHYAVTVILLHCCTSRSRWMKVSLKTRLSVEITRD